MLAVSPTILLQLRGQGHPHRGHQAADGRAGRGRGEGTVLAGGAGR